MWYALIAARVKNQTIAEVERQGAEAMALISQSVRNATAITSPAIGSSSASLTLSMAAPAVNPTVFSLAGGAIQMKEGSGSAVILTSPRLNLTALTFTNVSAATTPGVIRTQATISQVNPSGANEYSYTQTFYESTSIR